MTILIVEGCDGSGKSTLLDKAAAELDWSADFVMKLPRADMKAYWKRHPDEATAANMLSHVASEMEKHCARHPFAIFDRAWPSTMVYQGASFDDLPEFLRITPTIIYLVHPSLNDLMIRKARRDGVGVGSGLADHLSTEAIHAGYEKLRPMAPNHVIVRDDGPSLERFVTLCKTSGSFPLAVK
jgi:thymidylate kinase